MADVEKAFLQLRLQEEDRDVTRFFWIKKKNEPTRSIARITHRALQRIYFYRLQIILDINPSEPHRAPSSTLNYLGHQPVGTLSSAFFNTPRHSRIFEEDAY
uniref:Reverse transcriptase domain-containing protein n=1 Tax=Steinernema glaseri TaxID=37863 RepID=A0A1I8A102_9BILA